MKTQWEKEYTLRASDFDRFGHLQPAAVLDLFQDAAGQHAEELGIGFDAMLQKNQLWVVTRIKFQVVGTVKRHQTVRVRTWPLPPSRLSFRREYSIEDTNGRLLVKGSSDWVVMDSVKRRLVSAQDVYPFTEGFVTDKMFDEKLTKLHDFEAEGEPYRLCPGFSELDMNGHVNNTKYANFVLDAVSPAAEDAIDTLQIDYRKEVVAGTALQIGFVRNGKELLAKGQNGAGETMFTCHITLR